MTKVLDARRITDEVISAGHYARMSEAERKSVKVSEIVAPKLGGKGFGGVRIVYNTPVYRVK